MFDTFMGLPIHVLVSHFVVVLIPLGAAATIAVAVRRPWREKYVRPLAAGNVALLALTFVALRAGEDLKDRYRGLGDMKTPKFDHQAFGQTLVWIMVALALVSLAMWAVEPIRSKAPAATLGLAGVVALLAAASIVFSVLAGHTGAQSRWKEFVENSDEQLSKNR